jgi:hypothetical protein
MAKPPLSVARPRFRWHRPVLSLGVVVPPPHGLGLAILRPILAEQSSLPDALQDDRRQMPNRKSLYETLFTAVPQVLLVATYSPSIHTDVALLGSVAIAG